MNIFKRVQPLAVCIQLQDQLDQLVHHPIPMPTHTNVMHT